MAQSPISVPGLLGLNGIKVYTTQTGAVASTANTIPNDDTPPQSGEGAPLFSVTMTPRKATNILYHVVSLTVSANAIGTDVSAAIFQGAGTDAIASKYVTCANNYTHTLLIIYQQLAGTTSSTTWNVRYGGSGATVTINGIGGARKHGGVLMSSYSILEIDV